MATDEPENTADDASTGDAGTDLSEEVAKRYDPERLLRMLSARAGKGEALDATLRSRYERRYGVDLGHVRIITGTFAEEFNKQRNAYAVTVGGTGAILMGGSPDRSMATAAGQALLGHELAHVAQAKRGLFRAARTEGMPFAEEHEDAEHDAEAHEAAILAEEAGGSAASGPGPGTPQAAAKLSQAVVERVFEMLAEADRLGELRNGGGLE